MENTTTAPAMCTAFDGHRLIASGELPQVALAVRRAHDNHAAGPVLIYSDATGQLIDVDLRGSDAEIMDRLAPPHGPADAAEAEAASPRGRGRPRLGVVSREVTLLPRHWEWLARQPGGASVALRKLVEEARHNDTGAGRRRERQEAAYRFMSSIAGDLPGFEEAARALFADDAPRFAHHVANWPLDVRNHALRLAFDTDAVRTA